MIPPASSLSLLPHSPTYGGPPPAPAGGRLDGARRWAGDLVSQLAAAGGKLGRKRMIAGGVGIGALLAAANEMGDKNETANQNIVDAAGAGLGGLAALAPLALGMTGPAGWAAAGVAGLAGSQVGKAGLRGATDLIGLTRTESPEAAAIRQAENVAALEMEMNRRRRMTDLPLREKELALERQHAIEQLKAEVALRQQYEYAQAAMNMATGNTASIVQSVPSMANQVMSRPTVFEG